MTTAFALSGGGNLGPLQAGALAALADAGIRPDLLIGTSVGALNAAFLASRPGPEGAHGLVDAWKALRRQDVVALNPLLALVGLSGARNHLFATHRLRSLVGRWVGFDVLEEATTRLAVTATDALNGEAVVLSSGPARDALLASCAIPGLFPPVRLRGRWLVDGSLAANRPVLQALNLGATDVYVITTDSAPRAAPPRGAIAVAMNSVSLVTSRVAQVELAEATRRARGVGGSVRVVPSPAPPAPGPFDYRRSAHLADAAYERARAWLADQQLTAPGPGLRTPPPLDASRR